MAKLLPASFKKNQFVKGGGRKGAAKTATPKKTGSKKK